MPVAGTPLLRLRIKTMLKAAYYEGKRRIRIGRCLPAIPDANQVQIEVSYCGICGTDVHLFRGKMDHRVQVPQVFGHEMSGTIVAVGKDVKEFKSGDRATVRPLDPCGACPACRDGFSHVCHRLKVIGIDAPGALQALWTVSALMLHHLPDSLPMKTTALIEPLPVACHDVRLAGLRSDEYVVVQGGGPIGMLIAMVARLAGATVLISEVNPYRL